MLKKLFQSKIAKNASWIIVSKNIQAIISLLISMLTARYLGPGNFGLINYASSIVGFVIPVVFLGLNNTLVHELSVHPECEGEILGTSLFMSAISGILCILGILAFVCIANYGESDTIIVCGLYSMILLFQVIDLVQYWFHAKLLSKYSAMATLLGYIVVSLYKAILLINRMNVYWFAVANVIEFMVISTILLIIYFRLGGQKFTISKDRAKSMFSKSKYYIITGIMIAVFAQTDKIMLKLMISEIETGYYAAAYNCATLTSFFYVAVIDSFRPVIFKHHSENKDSYENDIIKLYSIIIYTSLIMSLIMTIFSRTIVGVLYGNEFFPATSALRIICWFTMFSYMGSIRNIWILCNELQRYLWIINLLGALLNILINYFLIPSLGAEGAAIASLITQFFTNFITGYIIKPIRQNNKLIVKAFNPCYVIRMLK